MGARDERSEVLASSRVLGSAPFAVHWSENGCRAALHGLHQAQVT
jgi:hypothetical protein